MKADTSVCGLPVLSWHAFGLWFLLPSTLGKRTKCCRKNWALAPLDGEMNAGDEAVAERENQAQDEPQIIPLQWF